MALTQVQGGMLAGSTNTTTTIQSNGTTAITIDSTQNVGIGTTSPAAPIDVVANSAAIGLSIRGRSDNVGVIRWMSNDGSTVNGRIQVNSGGDMIFQNTNSITERMRITSSGDVFIGTTTTFSYANGDLCVNANGGGDPAIVAGVNSTSSAYNNIVLGNSTGGVGRIQTNGSATAYLTSSDYRLKNNITPIQDALSTIESLKPVAFTWNVDNRQDAGFLAHEFQEVLPNYADGTKDEVDAEGNPVYQAVDKSGAIPYLVKAIQELKAELDATKAEVAALKAAP